MLSRTQPLAFIAPSLDSLSSAGAAESGTRTSTESREPRERFYYLPLMSSCLPGCRLCADLGCRNLQDRQIEDVERALRRAISAESTGVLFAPHLLIYPHRAWLIKKCLALGLRPIVQFPLAVYEAGLEPALGELRKLGCGLNLLFTESPAKGQVTRIRNGFEFFYFTWVVKRHYDLLPAVAALGPSMHERLYFYFPLHTKWGDGNLSCAQIKRVVQRLGRELPGLRVRPPRGIEVWDPRIDPDLCLEPVEGMTASCRSPAPRPMPHVSVVIPTYNNSLYLQNTLRHLVQQDLAPDEFEIVIVDDGSSDDTHVPICEFIRRHEGRLNCKYIYFPRRAARKMGDGRFRAGVARNLGVKNAAGELLCFLDSDILTPPHFLTDLIAKHQHYDVIQCTRLHLKNSVACNTVNYDDIKVAEDTFYTDGRYWENFYAVTDWQSLPFYWKYVCTYGLSMRRDVFKAAGWLKRTFVYYGFEDTELGYRLAKDGYRFYLNPIVTYHLYHGAVRSEFSNLDYLRHQLLSKTARIFYLHVLETEVFDHFHFYLRDRFASLRRLAEAFLLLRHWGRRPKRGLARGRFFQSLREGS